MRAQPGDWLVVKGVRLDLPEQRGRIVATGKPDGSPPFTVRWLADDRVTTVFPGSDAIVLTEAEVSEQDRNERNRFDRLRALRRGRRGARDVRT
ncbi:DUF1918 domain-containing protein [Amycolatopsis sp. NPDC004079]|uniref:DUF1918 domain-containing protein n=1 Tax=Amycolatopsis sp. NPDC004079 TaxID=3154549 RepID=UPI0033AD0135